MNYKPFLYFSLSFCGITSISQENLPFSNNPKEIIFAADTQAPMWVETLISKPDRNRLATKMLFSNIASVHPASVFLLGDVVNLGSSGRQWRAMDSYLKNLRDKGVGVHAVLGNHEVMGQTRKGERKFQQRFPDHLPTGYIEIVDSVAVVLLNSNFTTLSAEDNAKQLSWYKTTLQALDEDPGVLFIITGCHHSPFTDSKVVSPSFRVQNDFVPYFLASKKCRLFLSGHCHAFEHYQVKGKDFMVIGGGGGLHQALRETKKDQPDLASSYKPKYHYLSVKRINNSLQITSRQLNPEFTGFNDGLSFTINNSSNSLSLRK